MNNFLIIVDENEFNNRDKPSIYINRHMHMHQES